MSCPVIAQCPHCGSRFRVRQQQLDQARGRARCGACLEVFQAAENRVPEDGEPVEAQADTPDRPTADDAATDGCADAMPVTATPVTPDPNRHEAAAGVKAAAPRSPGGANWVHWALALAVLALIGQVLWHLGYIGALR